MVWCFGLSRQVPGGGLGAREGSGSAQRAHPQSRLPGALSAAQAGGTMNTASGSKHDVWIRQGQADHEMSPPAGSATSASDQLQGRGKCGKTGTGVFRASEGLSSHAALNCMNNYLVPPLHPHWGTEREGRSQNRHSAVPVASSSHRQSLCSQQEKPLPSRGLCSG